MALLTDTPTQRPLLAQLIGLAIPIVVARAGILVMGMVDVIMVGRYDTRELAYASLGNALFVMLLVTGVGLLIGVVAVTSQRMGAGDERACGEVWRDALPWAALVGGAGLLICSQGETIFRLFGQSAEMAEGAGAVALVLAPGLFGYAFFAASTFFLEGVRRPLPGMIAMLIANLLNFALNWVFIYGNLGAPELGAVGSALTTALVRSFLGIALVIYVLRMPDAERFGLRLARFDARGWWTRSRMQRRIGYGAGVSMGLETAGHAVLIQFAGLLGAAQIGAYSIAHNVEAVLFMAALGIGAATAVLVGNARGRVDPHGVRSAWRTGLGAGLIAMALAGACVALTRNGIAAIYTTDPALQALTAPVLAIAGLAILTDAGQMIVSQSVRAMGDVWPSALRSAMAFGGVMIPVGYLLGVVLEYGAAGLMAAVGIGCGAAMALQYLRYRSLVASLEAGTAT